MPAKKVMPKGGRKSSPTLWAIMHILSEDEWQAIASLAVLHHKDTLQFRLLTLLRSMEVYDPVAEKEAFKENDLRSLRKAAKRWVIRAAGWVGINQTEISQQAMDVDVLFAWGFHDDLEEFISEAKQLANDREEFAWLAVLLRKEVKAATLLFQGEERIDKVGGVMRESIEVGRLLALEAEIDHQHVMLVDRIRHDLLTNGTFDKRLAESYLYGSFHRQGIDGWPVSFQIKKLRIDEAIHYFMGDPKEASIVAERMLPLIVRLDEKRQEQSEEYPKCMFRLSAYYTEIGSEPNVIQIVDRFRELAFENAEIDHSYLQRLIYLLFHAAFQFDKPLFADEAYRIWNTHFDLLNRNSKEGIRFTVLLYVLAFQLSREDSKAARATFGLVSEVAKDFPHLIYQSLLRIFHMMILIDEQDDRGLQSYGKNYKRHLKAFLKREHESLVALAGLEIVTLLAKESNLHGASKLAKTLSKLILCLNKLKEEGDMNFTPFATPMTHWAELKRKSLILQIRHDRHA